MKQYFHSWLAIEDGLCIPQNTKIPRKMKLTKLSGAYIGRKQSENRNLKLYLNLSKFNYPSNSNFIPLN